MANGNSNETMMKLIAGMQAVENLRAQNAAAAQNLAAQLQGLSASTPAHDIVAQQRLALAAQAVAQRQAGTTSGSSSAASFTAQAPSANLAFAQALAQRQASSSATTGPLALAQALSQKQGSGAAAPGSSNLALAQALAQSQASGASSAPGSGTASLALAQALARSQASGSAGKLSTSALSGLSGGMSSLPPATTPGTKLASTPADKRREAARGEEKQRGKQEEEEEVPRCHLHKKQNKACKFCKVFYQHQELKSKRMEEQKAAALERLKEGSVANTGKGLSESEKSPLPNLGAFPQVMLDRIQRNDYYNTTIANSTVQEVMSIIAKAEACDTEIRQDKSLDLEPSAFIMCVYRLMTLQLTEGQLRSLLGSRTPWLRCAAFLYVRLGMHHERYWELMSDALMDHEEFVPFPARGGDTTTVGQFAEQLLTKDKYCDVALPRIPVAHRKIINKRMVLYAQFRRRYAANCEVLDRFEDSGVQVEICSADGEWTPAETVEAPSHRRQCKTLLVRLPEGEEREVSLGMVICPGTTFTPSNANDLTRSRGRSAEELLEKFEAQQRDAAVASGKDYCKTSGQHTLRVGGVPFVAGVKRKDLETKGNDDAEDEARREAKRSGPSLEHQAKLAAIESKYCARVGASASGRDRSDGLDGPERMRLG